MSVGWEREGACLIGRRLGERKREKERERERGREGERERERERERDRRREMYSDDLKNELCGLAAAKSLSSEKGTT